MVTAGQLRQSLEYDFASGIDRAHVTQNSGAFSYRYTPDGVRLDWLELNAYVADTDSRDLADRTYSVDTATLYELWNDPRRIAGGRVTGLQGRLGLSPWPGASLSLALGAERLEYDLLTGMDRSGRLAGVLEWTQQLNGHLRLKAGADSGIAQNRYRLGLERDLDGGQSLGFEASAIDGRDGAPDDRRLQVTWVARFGSGKANGTVAGQPRQASTLLEQVARRPAYLPAQVVAKVDTSAAPTRLVAVDKTGLPVGSSIDAASGDITVPLGVTVTGIAGITRDGGAFGNGGQFALAGNNLVVRPSLIAQPALADTDTYVVTINNQGGGTTVVTAVVSRGSVRIDSVVVSGGVADITAPSLTSGSDLGSADIGATVQETLTFDEAIGSVSVGNVPTGMTVTATRSGNTVTFTISTTASFTTFGSVMIPVTVADVASPSPNSRTENVTKTINDVAPVAGGAFVGLVDMTVSDASGNPIIGIPASGVTDSLGRSITYSATGLPGGLTINPTTGVIGGRWDSYAGWMFTENYNVTVIASNGSSSISKSFVLSIRDDG